MKEFLDGTRESDDAITIEEYVVEVKVLPDGSVESQDGKIFGADGRPPN